ncbi:MAG: SUMF1/EgtB/PvdO family nonheme iron enzyme [Pirellulales bacterium]
MSIPRSRQRKNSASALRGAIVLFVLLCASAAGTAWWLGLGRAPADPSTADATAPGSRAQPASAAAEPSQPAQAPVRPWLKEAPAESDPLPAPPADPLEGMVLIPAGPFLYGSDKEPRELPDYYIDRYEVSQAQYADFLEYVRRTGDHSRCHPNEQPAKDHTPLGWGKPDMTDPDFPVVGIDYWDVNGYAGWIGKRLPTEEEWEKAARGTDGRTYPWGNEWDLDRANWGPALGLERTLLAVDSMPEGASPYGCHHMLGNAAEWTASFLDRAAGIHVGRGYCWRLGHMQPFEITYRMPGQTNLRDEGSGLRCVLDPPEAEEAAPPENGSEAP